MGLNSKNGNPGGSAVKNPPAIQESWTIKKAEHQRIDAFEL